MTFIYRKSLTTHEARRLEHRGYIVRFVTFTVDGMLFDIYAK